MKHTVHEATLKNGAKGLIIDVPDATVTSFQFHFLAGNRYVADREAYETAHIMEHMAFGANSRFKDAHAFGMEFEKNGAHYNAYTSDLSMVYIADCADFEWDRILDLQRLAIACPRFIAIELASESGNVRGELTGYLNSHTRLLWPRLQQALGEPVLGYDERLKLVHNTTLRHIKQHYSTTHTSKNMRFAITGKMDGSRLSRVNDMLESWELEKGHRLKVSRDTLQTAEPFLIRRKEASNITFAWSMTVPRKLDDAELEAMACVDHILTGTLHSKILGAARRKGLAY
ncbi:MAG: M16 family metallopeptidase, partial [Candidatus Binatia bacterium]